jgi:tetratricopeptide (TPR) repeat protein
MRHLAIAALLLVFHGPAGAQDIDARIDRVQLWLNAVMRHEPGSADDSAEVVASWSNAAIRTLWIDTSVIVQLMRTPKGLAFTVRAEGESRGQTIRYTPVQLRRMKAFACAASGRIGDIDSVCGDAARELNPDLIRLNGLSRAAKFHGDDNYLLRHGALLHADIAMLIPPPAEAMNSMPGPGPRRLRMQIADGLGVDLALVATHWELARMLLDDVRPAGATRPAPGRDEMVRLWYRATAAWMQWRENHDTVHLERARAIFPADADILFLSGCQRETYAAPPIQTALHSTALPTGFNFDLGSSKAELHQAEAFFRRALAANPSMPEGHLRFGHVLLLLEHFADATAELRLALGSTDDGLLRYYGQMFLGASEDAAGHVDAARVAFTEAAALYPMAQSPGLALSALARSRGDRDGALRELKRVFDLPAGVPERDDPWWTYYVAQARNADDLLEQMRRPFVRAEVER